MQNKKSYGMFIQRTGFYLWVIFLLLIILSFENIKVAVIGYVILLVLIIYNVRTNYTRHKELTKYIENLTFNIDTATKDTLLNFPMPLLVVELDGTIIWYNSSFKSMFEGSQLLNSTVSSFVEELQPSALADMSLKISKQITIQDRVYDVLGNLAKVDEKIDKDNYILLLYFIDITELSNLRETYENEKIAVGSIVIDNYDDLMQSMDERNRPQMLAEIDKVVTEWFGYTNGIIKKFERDKYLYIFESKYIKDFIDKKFDILDIIKEINLENRIPVTLSLGFGINGGNLSENMQFAGSSIDMALARGGDQVVIKNGDNFSFFGGKTRELEKRTKVKARVIAYALRELIDQAPLVLIMGHENCDMDSLGSALGLYRVAKNKNKNVFIVLDSSNTSIENLLSKIEQDEQYSDIFIRSEEALGMADSKTLVIVVDTHRPGFTECPELLKYSDKIVVIDHHRRGTEYIQDAVLTYQEIYASSTCELVTEILQYIEDRIRLSQLEAEALYAGIVLDTKNFIFKTGVRTFEASAFLRRQGVDTVSVKQLFQNDLETYKIISDIVKDAEIINDNIAISVCRANIKNAQLICAQAADQLLMLSGLVAAFVLSNVNGYTTISGRSLGEMNVQMILEKLGGGGHMTVAGAQIPDISIEEAVDKLKNSISEYIEEHNATA